MRFSDRRAAIGLTAVGVVLAAGNLWTTAARSTIPLSIDGRLARCEVRPEKHRSDDVYLLLLDGGRVIQVDQQVAASVVEGQRLQKGAWKRTLHWGGAEIKLGWSTDFLGMLWAMPLVVALFVALATVVARRH